MEHDLIGWKQHALQELERVPKMLEDEQLEIHTLVHILHQTLTYLVLVSKPEEAEQP